MEPLQSVPAPTHAVLIGIDNTNSWLSTVEGQMVRLAYVATDSTQPVSFVSLQSATRAVHVVRLASRPTRFDDMPFGLVVEVYLTQDLGQNEAVHLTLAHAGATTYYPPQQIDDSE